MNVHRSAISQIVDITCRRTVAYLCECVYETYLCPPRRTCGGCSVKYLRTSRHATQTSTGSLLRWDITDEDTDDVEVDVDVVKASSAAEGSGVDVNHSAVDTGDADAAAAEAASRCSCRATRFRRRCRACRTRGDCTHQESSVTRESTSA